MIIATLVKMNRSKILENGTPYKIVCQCLFVVVSKYVFPLQSDTSYFVIRLIASGYKSLAGRFHETYRLIANQVPKTSQKLVARLHNILSDIHGYRYLCLFTVNSKLYRCTALVQAE